MTAGPGRRPRVLFVCADPVGKRMAGLGVRYTELAAVLCRHAEVTVAHGGHSSHPLPSGVPTVPYAPHDPSALKPLIDAADAVITHPQWPIVTSWLRRSRARVIFDLSDPETLETLELFSGRRPLVRRLAVDLTLDRLHDALRGGHHFMCASEKQRDLWLGALLALRSLGPNAYDSDPSLRSVLDIVPFGVPAAAPSAPSGPGPREFFPQLGDGDEIVLWNGGLWRWLDPETAIRAVAALERRRPGVRLVFMGGSDQPAAVQTTERARTLASDLGVLDSSVLFNPGWVPYAERVGWLAQASCALATHPDHLETRFAFRTRLLDCFWAGLPVVCTRGDDLADRVAREGLGATVPPGEPLAVADALERVLDRGRASHAPALARAAADHAWPRVARPLKEWVTALGPPPRRIGSAPTALRPSPGHVARALAYRLGGRQLLARRAAMGGLHKAPDPPSGGRRRRCPGG